jgi:hypothetical protein
MLFCLVLLASTYAECAWYVVGPAPAVCLDAVREMGRETDRFERTGGGVTSAAD